MLYFFVFEGCGDHRHLHVLTHSFPTRRSSDLHRVIPAAAAILSLKERSRAWTGTRSVERVLLRSLARIKETPEASFSIDVYFGRTADPRYERVAREAFDRFRAPILRVQVRRDPEWGFYVKAIRPRPVDELHAAEQPTFDAPPGA